MDEPKNSLQDESPHGRLTGTDWLSTLLLADVIIVVLATTAIASFGIIEYICWLTMSSAGFVFESLWTPWGMIVDIALSTVATFLVASWLIERGASRFAD